MTLDGQGENIWPRELLMPQQCHRSTDLRHHEHEAVGDVVGVVVIADQDHLDGGRDLIVGEHGGRHRRHDINGSPALGTGAAGALSQLLTVVIGRLPMAFATPRLPMLVANRRCASVACKRTAICLAVSVLISLRAFRRSCDRCASLSRLISPSFLTTPKEAFFRIWDAPNKEAAWKAMDAWLAAVPEQHASAFVHTPHALQEWGEEVLAYWGRSVTNPYTEAANGLAKIANRTGCGYGFEVIRARILHTLRTINPEEMVCCDGCGLGFLPGMLVAMDAVTSGRGRLKKDFLLCPNCYVRNGGGKKLTGSV
jgi:Transposase